MRSRALVFCLVLAVGLTGCEKIPFLGKRAGSDTAVVDTTTVAAPTPAPAETTAAPARQAPPPPEPEPRAQPARRLVDEPWTPTHTGTVAPGMSRADVIAQWGPPVAERHTGDRGYLYYRNGCEVTCGTFDVVFLEADQVVDAIVRGPGHTYAGVSSSPPDRQAEFTPPQSMNGGSMGALE